MADILTNRVYRWIFIYRATVRRVETCERLLWSERTSLETWLNGARSRWLHLQCARTYQNACVERQKDRNKQQLVEHGAINVLLFVYVCLCGMSWNAQWPWHEKPNFIHSILSPSFSTHTHTIFTSAPLQAFKNTSPRKWNRRIPRIPFSPLQNSVSVVICLRAPLCASVTNSDFSECILICINGYVPCPHRHHRSSSPSSSTTIPAQPHCRVVIVFFLPSTVLCFEARPSSAIHILNKVVVGWFGFILIACFVSSVCAHGAHPRASIRNYAFHVNIVGVHTRLVCATAITCL